MADPSTKPGSGASFADIFWFIFVLHLDPNFWFYGFFPSLKNFEETMSTTMELSPVRWVHTPEDLIFDEGQAGNWICYEYVPFSFVIAFDVNKVRQAQLIDDDNAIIFPTDAPVTIDPVVDAYAWEEMWMLRKYHERTNPVGPFRVIDNLNPLPVDLGYNENPQDPLGYDMGIEYVRGRAAIQIKFIELRLGFKLDDDTKANIRTDMEDIWYGR
jgi:hypothetical protein